MERRKEKCSERIWGETWQWVERLPQEDRSPEQISLWLAREKRLFESHEWIYRYVLQDKRAGGDLHTHQRCQKPRRKRFGTYDRRGKIPNRKSIEELLAVVERRSRIGDWELNTINWQESLGRTGFAGGEEDPADPSGQGARQDGLVRALGNPEAAGAPRESGSHADGR